MERSRSRKISLADLHVFPPAAPEPPARLRLTGFGLTKVELQTEVHPKCFHIHDTMLNGPRLTVSRCEVGTQA